MTERVKDELKRGLESANQLRLLFAESTVESEQNNQTLMAYMNHHSSVILHTFDTAISIMKNGQFTQVHPNQIPKLPTCYGKSRNNQTQPVKNIRSSVVPEDGYAWRKYGQKPIANTKYPREYYRCGHHTQGCRARKQVQMVSDNPTKYGIIYYGHHTCQNLLIPVIDYDGPPTEQLLTSVGSEYPNSINMICFESSNTNTNTKLGPNLIENQLAILKEDKPSSFNDIYAPSSSTSSSFVHDHIKSVSLNPTVVEPIKKDVEIPEDLVFPMGSPMLLDEDFRYMLSDDDVTPDLSLGFDEFLLWEL